MKIFEYFLLTAAIVFILSSVFATTWIFSNLATIERIFSVEEGWKR
jgi:hypothetical protein